MSGSWGHEVVRATPEELARWEAVRDADRFKYGRSYDADCSIGKRTHVAAAGYWLRYSYVTGRAGRTTFANKRACEEHARKFAYKHGIDFDAIEDGARIEHAGEAAVREVATELGVTPRIPPGP